MERLANLLFNKSKIIIGFVAILNIIAVISFVRFKLDTEFMSFFSGGNPKAVAFDQLNEKYLTGETISVLIEHTDSLLAKDSLIKAFKLLKEFGSIDDVALVQGFVPSELPSIGGMTPVNETFIENNYQTLLEFIEKKSVFTDQFLAPDKRTGIFVVALNLDAPVRDVIKAMKEIARNQETFSLSLAGNEIIQDTLWNYLIRIILIFPPTAIILVLLVFYTIIRNRKLTLLAIVPAGLAALWAFGTIFWSGQGLNMVTIISPIFIIVIGSAYGLHYVSHLQQNQKNYSDRLELTVATMRMVGVPIFLATITTMAGFMSLTWAKVIPMREMGIFVTLGVGFAGFNALFFLPAVLTRVKLGPPPDNADEHRLVKLVLAASQKRLIVGLAFLTIIILAVWFIPKLEVESNQLLFFKKGTEIRQTFSKIEKSFGGAMPLIGEIVNDKGLDILTDFQFAERALGVERELEKVPGIKSVFSIFDLAAGVNKMMTGQQGYPRNPMIGQLLSTQLGEEGLKSWVSVDGLRIMIRTQDITSSQIAGIEEFVAKHQDIIRVISGMPVLFDEMNNLVVSSQTRSLGLALVLIFVMLLITLRKFSAGLIGLVPIIITITAVLGMLALTKFNLNLLTANLSAMTVGIGVDYSIHLISGIYFFRKLGQGKKQSVDSALSSVSRPILANAFGLAIGLSVFFFSPLRIHLQVASVMWVAMIISSMAALLLIPLLYLLTRAD